MDQLIIHNPRFTCTVGDAVHFVLGTDLKLPLQGRITGSDSLKTGSIENKLGIYVTDAQ